ncbi:hypothetical protein B0H11DRAFT_2231793 [Mycena galericulata]|nr:hypothetical protein B0H11DRAFT_2256231 [Mycena galericulata]KAJ7437313.1 hypothetical protein B0H11DRAFT_2255539 [Mycena galericulata]KAJ7439890.1 hypothetical protein B0H11DRAFT_2253424 [Mycena galericulata]KAJ7484061.1 hypothetical protein B0H11DRAFT_2231793 [Mycena galericulata]
MNASDSTPTPSAPPPTPGPNTPVGLNTYWNLASVIYAIRTMQRDPAYLAERLKEYHEREFVAPDKCSWCQVPLSATEELFRCHQRGCLEGLPACAACIGIAHQTMPKHLIEEWADNGWHRTSLRRAGFVQQLGHDGMPCPNPATSVEVQKVLHLDGVHELWTRECGCARS